MRPVNLIPPEERTRGRAGAPTRTGPLVYVVVGALVAVLVAVTAVVLTGNQISDRRAEVASLKQEEEAARARAQALGAFASFAALSEARVQTVSSLARSRFDWERVLQELATVIPGDVWLVKLTGTVSADVAVEDGAEIALRDDVQGPALEIAGCGADQEAVAGFLAALRDIDGVTRVTAANSTRSTEASGGASGESSGDGCGGRSASFEIVAAFDAVEVDPSTQLLVPPAEEAAPTAAATGTGQAGQQQEAGEQGTASVSETTGRTPGA